MDIVVVTCAADAHLLRFFLASYETFWDGGGRLILATRRSDSYLWQDIRLPPNTRLIYREDFPELGADDFRNHLYLKLVSHQFVESEYYAVMDSDFLFVAPCSDDAFFAEGKPIWFRRDWLDSVAAHWRAGSEAFVGESIDHQYMSEPQYALSRKIAAELCRRYDPRRVFEIDGVSEFMVYGWFAHRFFRDAYHWLDSETDAAKAMARPVNQVPPSYHRLDPSLKLADFPGTRYLAFWSHWDLAESKMAEFLEEAQRRYPDRPKHFPARARIYPSIQLPAPPETLYSQIRGIDSDGWLKDEVWFAVDDPSPSLKITLEVPSGPITGSYQVATKDPEQFRLETGLNSLTISMHSDGQRHPILLRFDASPAAVTDSTGRTLRARLIGLNLDVQPKPGDSIETHG